VDAAISSSRPGPGAKSDRVFMSTGSLHPPTDGDKGGGTPVAPLVPYHTGQRQFDTLPDLVVHMDVTFGEPLYDFAHYMTREDPT